MVSQTFMSLMDVGIKLDMALLVKKMSDLYLLPDSKGQYRLFSVCMVCRAKSMVRDASLVLTLSFPINRFKTMAI